MAHYRGNKDAIRALVRPGAVHRDVYLNDEIYDLEMERLFRNTWVFVGHDSQIPNPGDYTTTDIGTEPVIMIRDTSANIHVLLNRCAHKGTKLVAAREGNSRSVLRCPYHGWTYEHTGKLKFIPVQQGYDNTDMLASQCGGNLTQVQNVRNYRGFVFVRLNDQGQDFEAYFGDTLSSIDNMVDRAPEGRLEIAGGVLRYMHNCNWKMFVENLNDNMHPMVAHDSSAGTAKEVWYSGDHSEGTPKPMVVEQFEPFVAGYEFMDKMGVQIGPNGNGFGGANVSIHSAYSEIEAYNQAMIKAYGKDRVEEIFATNRHNTVYYPTLTIKGAIQAIRIARPIAADKTLIESWTFRLVGAPDDLLKRTIMYSRLINAPTSMVGHDDLHCYRSIQEGLRTTQNVWVSLHRGYDKKEDADIQGLYNGTNEVSMRGQYRAWRDRMTEGVIGGN